MSSTCVRMQIEWSVPLGQTRSLTMALHSVAADTRAMHGCTGCSVSTDMSNRATVHYTEEWLTEDDLRLRLQSESFSRLAALIEEVTQPPYIKFHLAQGTRGLDFVEEVRAHIP